MTDTEKNAIELNAGELAAAGGGYKPLPEKPGCMVYQIQKGDNLNRIARTFGCTVEELMRLNPKITNANRIFAGDYIYVVVRK